jgi:hypothetical protein
LNKLFYDIFYRTTTILAEVQRRKKSLRQRGRNLKRTGEKRTARKERRPV